MKIKYKDGVGIHGHMTATTRDAKTGEVLEVFEVDNVVCNRYLAVLASRANSETTYNGFITHLAVGTGTNLPSSSDTQLQAELARTVVADRNRVGGALTLTFFFDTGDANGTLNEASFYVDATSIPNSGQIGDRVNLPAINKTSAITLTVTLNLSFVSV